MWILNGVFYVLSGIAALFGILDLNWWLMSYFAVSEVAQPFLNWPFTPTIDCSSSLPSTGSWPECVIVFTDIFIAYRVTSVKKGRQTAFHSLHSELAGFNLWIVRTRRRLSMVDWSYRTFGIQEGVRPCSELHEREHASLPALWLETKISDLHDFTVYFWSQKAFKTALNLHNSSSNHGICPFYLLIVKKLNFPAGTS